MDAHALAGPWCCGPGAHEHTNLPMSYEVRFVTSVDSRFFVAAAAMLDSLRVTGHVAPAFVIDAGLRSDERKRLAAAAEVLTLPSGLRGLHPLFAKLTADLFWSKGVVVLLDSDMIVTSPLDDLIEQAAAGRIAVHPDHEITRGRQFQEWASAFELQAPLRPQRSGKTAPLALSLNRWPSFLERWRRACDRLPADWPSQGFLGPFGLADQDALNALLMSEIPSRGHMDRVGRPNCARGRSPLRSRSSTPDRSDAGIGGGSPVRLHHGLSRNRGSPAAGGACELTTRMSASPSAPVRPRRAGPC